MSNSIKNIQLSRRKFLSHSAKSAIGLAVAINIPLAGNALAADEKTSQNLRLGY